MFLLLASFNGTSIILEIPSILLGFVSKNNNMVAFFCFTFIKTGVNEVHGIKAENQNANLSPFKVQFSSYA